MLKSPRVEGWGALEGGCSEELGAGRNAPEAGGQRKGRPSCPEVGFNPSCASSQLRCWVDTHGHQQSLPRLVAGEGGGSCEEGRGPGTQQGLSEP